MSAPVRDSPRWFDTVAVVAVAWTVGVSQPVLDVLGRHPEFFVARDAPLWAAVLLAIVVAVAIPLLLGGVVALAHVAGPRVGAVAIVVVAGGAVGLLIAQLIDRVTRGRGAGWVVLLVGLAGGAAIAWLYLRARRAWTVVRVVAVAAPLLVVGLFIVVSPARRAFGSGQASTAPVTASDPAPVVMVVLDELPLATLLDQTLAIDDQLFPNIARLAGSSTWFRNTTAVDGQTRYAVPAILDGRYPSRGLPTLADHPRNLFTLLRGQYAVHASEPVTRLCPTSACAPVAGDTGRLARDAGVIALHVVLPDRLTGWLPAIDEGWGDFGAPAGPGFHALAVAAAESDRAGSTRRFIADILDTGGPQLEFLHVLLPHRPWVHLPSAQTYTIAPGVPFKDEEVWSDDDWIRLLARQQHVLQAQAVDRLLGELLDQLDATGLFDRSLIVVTADHGYSFVAGQSDRIIERATAAGLAPVPLLVKLPGQSAGIVDDRPLETVDVLPTILDALGAPVPTDIDGRSALADLAPRAQRVAFANGRRDIALPTDLRLLVREVRRKYSAFGVDRGSIDPWVIAPAFAEGLVGRAIDDLELGGDSGMRVALGSPERFVDVARAGPTLPVAVWGVLSGEQLPPVPVFLAIVVNGRIAGVGRTWYLAAEDGRFHGLVHPDALREGSNEVSVHVIRDDGTVSAAMPPG